MWKYFIKKEDSNEFDPPYIRPHITLKNTKWPTRVKGQY